MSTAAPRQAAPAKTKLAGQAARAVQAGLLLQRKCACGSPASSQGSDCVRCKKKRLQTKLVIGASNDPAEREADLVADRVLAGSARASLRATPPRIQRLPAVPGEGLGAAPSSVDAVLSDSGSPLAPALGREMEQRFGCDFSKVRIHSNSLAGQSARDVNANAFTVGNHIVFAAGRFAPHSPAGRHLLAHELTHVVQQGAAMGEGHGASRALAPDAIVQREVEHEGVESADQVLGQVSSIANRYLSGAPSGGGFADNAAKKAASVASVAIANNLGRLMALSLKFNPGAPGQAGPTNKFVYTCHCGWLDMGHFFISALVSYIDAYAQQLALRSEGVPVTQGELVAWLFDKAGPALEPLLDTVGPKGQGKDILARQRKLLESGDPRDVSLAGGGFFTEYYQQLAKVVADRMKTVPQQLKDEQRSAFTIEDLPSDCYGAALGQDLWNRVSRVRKGLDLSPIEEMMSRVFADCKAVHPTGKTLCDMMSETTPGSCTMENGQPKWSGGGTPRQNIKTAPRQLRSAKPLCGDAPAVLPCKSGTGPSAAPPAKAVLDISKKNKSATAIIAEDITPPPLSRDLPLTLHGPTFVRIDARGNVTAYSKVRGIPGVGDEKTAVSANLGTGRFSLRATGSLGLHANGRLTIDFVKLFKGVIGPEVAAIKEILASDAFSELALQALGGQLGPGEFVEKVKVLIRPAFPRGYGKAVETVLQRLVNVEDLAINASLDASGGVDIGGVPVTGFIVHKSRGQSPLLGFEGGLLLSELSKGRVILGGKGWLYGSDILQAQLTAGIDPVGRAAVASLRVTNKTLTGRELKLDLRFQHTLEGSDAVSAKLGFDF